MSQDESRPFLNGLYLIARKQELRLVATDGHRLALARSAVDADVEMAGIVPRKAVQEITRVLGGAERVDLAVGESKFYVRTEGFELVSKLVEGQFPNYEQVIPKSSPLRLVVEREPLLAAIRRVAVVADDRTRPVRLTASAGQVRLSAQSQELGEAEETLPAEFERRGADDRLQCPLRARCARPDGSSVDRRGAERRLEPGRSSGRGGQEQRAG